MMVTFSRKVICIVILLGLSVMVGCSTMSGGHLSRKPGLFSWSKPKEEKKVTSVNEFIARERPSIVNR